jgi:hypothetical protein
MMDTAINAFNRELGKNGYLLNYSPDKPGEFSLAKPDGTTPYDQNKPIQVKDFATRVLAENKILKVSGTPQGGQPTPQPTPIVIQQGGGGSQIDTSAYMNAINQSLAEATKN